MNRRWLVIQLKPERSLRLAGWRRAHINCVRGVAWVTREGDVRDHILGSGECLDVGDGVTMITALEPTVIDIEKSATLSRLRGIVHIAKVFARSAEQWLAMSGSRGGISPVPYY